MKIQLQLTLDDLVFINAFIGNNLTKKEQCTSKESLSNFYMIIELLKKLLKKMLDKQEVKKPFLITIKYYEAFTLHQFLLIHIDYQESENRRMTRKILAALNQKLA